MKWVNPFKNQEISSFLHRLEKEFYELDYLPADSLRLMKNKLEDLKIEIPPKYHKYVNATMFNLNRNLERRQEDGERHNHRKHPMSDHAFVRCLELIHGLNIDELKDKAIKDVEESDSCRPLYRDNRIVTVLKKDPSDEKAPQEQICQRPAHVEVQDARRAG